MTKRALITGITGQDGSYLTELLLSKGYEVHGIIRRSSSFNTGRLDGVYQDPHSNPKLKLHFGDLTDASSLQAILEQSQPDEIYNLGAQSHVRVSFDIPEYTTESVALGTLRLLEAVRRSGLQPRIYQAGSSEMFGASPPPQNESTPFRPRSPYACAKVFAHNIACNYRDAYGMWIANGILFNHESPRRGETFVTRKITRAVAKFSFTRWGELHLGKLHPRRDWGFAGDYVMAMWLMLQQNCPQDFVVATGVSHSVQEFVDAAFGLVGLLPAQHITYDPRYDRPSEVEDLRGDPSKARELLGWSPSVDFHGLVKLMVESDLQLAKREFRPDARARAASSFEGWDSVELAKEFDPWPHL